VTYRVRVHSLVERKLAGLDLGATRAAKARAETVRPVSFAGHPKPIDALVIDRADLTSGAGLDGPALIEESDTTTAVPPGWRAELDGVGDLVVTRTGSAGDGTGSV
jgi:N-methylhydantoinase A/oxoprolinase/acetone carboxylase beta subunit